MTINTLYSVTDIAAVIEASLDKDKAEDIMVIDLSGKSSLADTMVIASGRSARHISAMAEHLMETLKHRGYSVKVEGLKASDWVLIDAGDAIIHLFRPEVRAFYNLEKMWGLAGPVQRMTPAPFADSALV